MFNALAQVGDTAARLENAEKLLVKLVEANERQTQLLAEMNANVSALFDVMAQREGEHHAG